MTISIEKLRKFSAQVRELKRNLGIDDAPPLGWDAIMTKERRRALGAAIRRDSHLDAETRARADEIVTFIEKNTTPDIFFFRG